MVSDKSLMSKSATLLLSYYKLQDISRNISDIDIVKQDINDILKAVSSINCGNPYEINLKGLIFQLSGKMLRKHDMESASDFINQSINFFEKAIDYRKTQFSTISIQEIYLNLGNARNMLYHPDQKENAVEQAHRSENEYNIALESKNKDVFYKAYIGLSYANYVLGNYEKGIEDATKAIDYFKEKKTNSNDLASVYNNRGLIYAALGKTNHSNFQNASDDFNEALNVAPQFIEARYNLENLNSNAINEKIQIGKFEEAEKDISSISDESQKIILNHNLANGYYENDNPGKALKILRDIFASDSNNSPSTILLCSILNSRSECTDEDLNKLTAINSDDSFYTSAQNLIGCIYYSRGNYGTAIEYLKNAVESETDLNKKKSFQKNLAICHFENNEKEKGEEILTLID